MSSEVKNMHQKGMYRRRMEKEKVGRFQGANGSSDVNLPPTALHGDWIIWKVKIMQQPIINSKNGAKTLNLKG